MLEKQLPYKYKIYEIIKEGIMEGQYLPGDVLNERKLSEEMGISRTPIREAIQLLNRDGWIVFETYKGAVIREFDRKYIEEVMKIRKALEMLAVDDVCGNVSPKELEELEEILQAQRDLLDSYDAIEFIRLDRDFHRKLYELSQNETLMDLLSNFNDIIRYFGMKAIKREVRKTTTVQEHEAVLNALKKGDAAEAVEAMRVHMEETSENIRQHM